MSFTPFQKHIARTVLDAIADLGFALGGGQALHAHGYGDRLSYDLDFYIPQFDKELFDRAEAAVLAALRGRGYEAEVGHSDSWLRQIIVTDSTSEEQVVLDLGQDYRQEPPVRIAGIGAVIDLSDAATSKARALNDRRAARDYLDIHALLALRTVDTGNPVHVASRPPEADDHRGGVRYGSGRCRRTGPRGLPRLRARSRGY